MVGSRWLKDLLRLASGKKGPKNRYLFFRHTWGNTRYLTFELNLRYKAVEERLRQDGWPPRTVGPAAAGDGGADEVHFESGIRYEISYVLNHFPNKNRFFFFSL